MMSDWQLRSPKRLLIVLPGAIYALLIQYCIEHGRSPSDVITSLLEDFFRANLTAHSPGDGRPASG